MSTGFLGRELEIFTQEKGTGITGGIEHLGTDQRTDLRKSRERERKPEEYLAAEFFFPKT